MAEPSLVVIFITTASPEDAGRIADELLGQRKAACSSIISGVDSRFRWQGRAESAEECLLLVKTRRELLGEVTELVRGIHNYEVPEIIALPVIGGNAEYLDWVIQETE